MDLNLILSLISFVIFFFSFVYGITTANKIYGGRFSGTLPEFAAAITIFFTMGLLQVVFTIAMPAMTAQDTFRITLQTMQIVGGVFFAKALYLTYQVSYATTGFTKFEEAKK